MLTAHEIKILAIKTVCEQYNLDYDIVINTMNYPKLNKRHHYYLKRYMFYARMQIFITGYIYNIKVQKRHTPESYVELIKRVRGFKVGYKHPSYKWWTRKEFSWD